MLSDEERKAIKEIRSFNQYNWELNNLKTKKFAKPYFDSLDTILNLIEKQSKEIEELKNADLTTVYLNGVYDGEKKVKDKIKAKIEEYERLSNNITIQPQIYPYIIEVLQSLLEKE